MTLKPSASNIHAGCGGRITYVGNKRYPRVFLCDKCDGQGLKLKRVAEVSVWAFDEASTPKRGKVSR